MPENPDRTIVEKALAGDAIALRKLVEKHQSFVYRVAYRLVGTAGDAEDITQDAFVRLWKNLHRYRPEVKLTTWLYKIVANVSLDFLKSRQRRTAKNTVGLDNDLKTVWSADQSLMDVELRLAVERLAEKLSPKQKAVFVLRDLEELDISEISEILSMDSGQVKSNLYYARKRIAELITIHYQIKNETKP